jgi:putative transposase
MQKATRNCTLRLYPTKRQEAILSDWLELHRQLYNNSLAERKNAWEKKRRVVSYNEQQNTLPDFKEQRPEYVPLGSHALQETVRRVDRAYKAFFRRVKNGEKPGYPRFKGRNRFDSFTYPCVSGWKLLSLGHEKKHGCKGKLRISNLGDIRLRGRCRVDIVSLERKDMPRLTVKRIRGKWYATITYKADIPLLQRDYAEKRGMTGIDLGLWSFATFASGESLPRLRHLDRDLCWIKQAGKDVSRKKKGSNRRRKTVAKLSRLHEKVSERRKDYLHKTAGRLVHNYSFLAVEDLQVKEMSANGGKRKQGLNRSMADAALGKFLKLLTSKAEEAGCEIVRVNPRGTTQECSWCGQTVPKTLYDRVHSCPDCGLTLDRDHNAAINIFKRGLALTGREPSDAWRSVRPGFAPASSLKCETATMKHSGR